MRRVKYSLFGRHIEVASDWELVFEWIQMTLSPYICVGGEGHCVATIQCQYGSGVTRSVYAAEEIPIHLGKVARIIKHSDEDLAIESSDGVQYRRQGTHVVATYPERTEEFLRDPARICREILYNALPSPGWVEFHAAAVARSGKAIVFGGPKGAGKTTLLCHLLSSARRTCLFDFVSNDRVWVQTGPAESPTILGSPMPVLVGYGTMASIPELARQLSTYDDGFAVLTKQWALKRHEYSVSELASLFQTGITTQATLVAYIELVPGPGLSISPVESEEERNKVISRAARDKVDSYPNWLGLGRGAAERASDGFVPPHCPVYRLEVEPSGSRMAASGEVIVKAFSNLFG